MDTMKKIVMLASFLCVADVGFAQQATVDRVAWLQGCWRSTRGETTIEEQWMAPRGGDDARDGAHGSWRQARGIRARADQGTGRPPRVRGASIRTAVGDVHWRRRHPTAASSSRTRSMISRSAWATGATGRTSCRRGSKGRQMESHGASTSRISEHAATRRKGREQ